MAESPSRNMRLQSLSAITTTAPERLYVSAMRLPEKITGKSDSNIPAKAGKKTFVIVSP